MISALVFDWLLDPLYAEWLLRGIVTTVQIAALGTLLMLVVGVLGAWLLHYRIRVFSSSAVILVDLFRNTPPLVQLFVLYFVLPGIGFTTTNGGGATIPIFNGFVCVVISLALYNGALAVEIIRPEAMIEAARSLAYTRRQIFFQVELPMGLRISFAPMINNLVSLIKTSSQASLVAVGDIMFYANQIALETFMNLEVMLVILVLYLTIVSLTVLGANQLENRVRMYGYGK